MNGQERETGPEISALITCYFEEKTIDEFHAKLSAALEASGRSYEIILVNDGSTDRTFDKLRAIFDRDPHVTCIIDMFKNAGQPAAVTAAICEAHGAVMLSMDSDLQLDPADLPILLAEYDKGYDVVSGYRKDRKDSLLRQWPSVLANIIMRKASGTKFRDFGCTFKLYNGKLIRAFSFGPLNVFNPVTAIAASARCKEVPVAHAPRKHGKSGWTFKKLWNYQMDQMVIMTEKPFQYLGIGALALAALFMLRVIGGWFTPFQVLREVTPGLLLNALMIAFLVLLGCLCMIGEFTIRSFRASRNVPKYIVRERIRRDPPTS
ncbi:MAG TPA: glycosyltransferase family 2 protein [Candidatus Hydrogenedentes bacterium]|nr:glycosyltransferase family 2 protein [Candidatus Hydrogenedentota bacterium]HNT86832.1 glycosyltransferase family 2 protein [Candidatus Hydrogenedentota bacterium]